MENGAAHISKDLGVTGFCKRLKCHWLPPPTSLIARLQVTLQPNGNIFQFSASSENAGAHAALDLQKVTSSFISLGRLASPVSLHMRVTLDRLLRCSLHRFPLA